MLARSKLARSKLAWVPGFVSNRCLTRDYVAAFVIASVLIR
jgi:hypothetical protein